MNYTIQQRARTQSDGSQIQYNAGDDKTTRDTQPETDNPLYMQREVWIRVSACLNRCVAGCIAS